jgi:DNA processing protein
VLFRSAWAVLASVDGLGPLTFGLLLREHGSALRVLELAGSEAGLRLIREGRSVHAPGDPPGEESCDRDRLPERVVAALGIAAGEAGRIVARLERAGVTVLTIEERAYPVRLRALEEPPPVLFVRGSLDALSATHAVAVVGTRRPTEAGRRIASRIADAVARMDACVVSGLALGIDGAAHAAVVAAGRPTVAVLGSGHDRLFPRAHVRLAEAIVEAGGALVSELPPDASPSKGTFPRRNRVISGLAEATVVVEAAARSGALITARWALEQGRECFLVPGSIDAPASAGCLAFLREFPGQARLVAGVAELIDDLGFGEEPVGPGAAATVAEPTGGAETRGAETRLAPSRRPLGRRALLATLGTTEGAIAGLLADGATTVDELASAADLPVATVLSALTLLEIRGLVVDAYGRFRAAGQLAAVAPRLP